MSDEVRFTTDEQGAHPLMERKIARRRLGRGYPGRAAFSADPAGRRAAHAAGRGRLADLGGRRHAVSEHCFDRGAGRLPAGGLCPGLAPQMASLVGHLVPGFLRAAAAAYGRAGVLAGAGAARIQHQPGCVYLYLDAAVRRGAAVRRVAAAPAARLAGSFAGDLSALDPQYGVRGGLRSRSPSPLPPSSWFAWQLYSSCAGTTGAVACTPSWR